MNFESSHHFVEVNDFWPALKMGGKIDLFKSKADDLKSSREDFMIFLDQWMDGTLW